MRRLRAPEQGAIDPIARGHVMFLRWAIVLGIVAYLVAWFIMPDSPATHAVAAPSVA